MDSRQEQLLNLVVETYRDTAEPVGSRSLISDAGLDWSEATVRNELRALEEQGYLMHPHTSAGRVPTELGYRYYLEHFDFSKAKISKNDIEALEAALTSGDKAKSLAKALVEISGQTVIMAFTLNKIYYTGLSNLFSQPEFKELNLVADVSRMFDHCDECLAGFFDKVSNEPKYFVGTEHPFGQILSVVAFRFGNDAENLIALMGPMRMDYKKNWGLINKIKELI